MLPRSSRASPEVTSTHSSMTMPDRGHQGTARQFAIIRSASRGFVEDALSPALTGRKLNRARSFPECSGVTTGNRSRCGIGCAGKGEE